MMKKWIAALIALMMAVLCTAVFAEEPAADTEEETEALFDCAWGSEGGVLEAYYMDGYWKVEITDGSGDFLWDYICVYDPELNALAADTSVENTKTAVVHDEEGSETGREILYTDGDAVFTLDEEGYLLWEDRKEDAGAGLRYEKIGWYLGEYECGDYSMSVFWDITDIKVEIEKTEGEVKTVWTYTAFFSPEDGTLRAPSGICEYRELEEGPFMTVYEDGAAVFSIDEEGNISWTDEKENAGEGLLFAHTNG